MNTIDNVAESRILRAIETGELHNLPGSGKPLNLTDDSAVPEELRVAWRVLKNAGLVPPEVAKRAEINRLSARLSDQADTASSHARRRHLARRLSLLRMELEQTSR